MLKQSEYASHKSISLNRQRMVDKAGNLKDEDTLFVQFFKQANSLPANRFRDGSQPFTIEFVGEYGDDAGGLFREAMTVIFKEVQSNPLTLFIPSPNGRMDCGRERDVFIPNPRSTTTLCIQMYEFLGKMIGVVIRTQNTVPLNLADLFWKRLVGLDITVSDIQSIDQEFITVGVRRRRNAQQIEMIQGYDTSEEEAEASWKQRHLTYTVKGSDDKVVELFPGGKNITVPWSERSHYLEMLIDYRLKEFDTQIDAVCRRLLRALSLRSRTGDADSAPLPEAVHAEGAEGDRVGTHGDQRGAAEEEHGVSRRLQGNGARDRLFLGGAEELLRRGARALSAVRVGTVASAARVGSGE